jgi:hypothetical protein
VLDAQDLHKRYRSARRSTDSRCTSPQGKSPAWSDTTARARRRSWKSSQGSWRRTPGPSGSVASTRCATRPEPRTRRLGPAGSGPVPVRDRAAEPAAVREPGRAAPHREAAPHRSSGRRADAGRYPRPLRPTALRRPAAPAQDGNGDGRPPAPLDAGRADGRRRPGDAARAARSGADACPGWRCRRVHDPLPTRAGRSGRDDRCRAWGAGDRAGESARPARRAPGPSRR